MQVSGHEDGVELDIMRERKFPGMVEKMRLIWYLKKGDRVVSDLKQRCDR